MTKIITVHTCENCPYYSYQHYCGLIKEFILGYEIKHISSRCPLPNKEEMNHDSRAANQGVDYNIS